MKRSKVEDINRNIYDVRNSDDYDIKLDKGVNESLVREISRIKNEPSWMLDIRLEALKVYEKLELPNWGPDLSELDLSDISTYVKPKSLIKDNWNEVDSAIKDTFTTLGVAGESEDYLGGVTAQYDSEVVYHKLKDELEKLGIIYTDMDSAVRDYPSIVKKHFMKCVKIDNHKFSALHAAVWSGGSFVYIPKNVKVDIPIQSYFRLNSPESGQFEHTMIILEENASLHFIEGCSAPTYNKLNLHAGCVELYVGDNSYLKYSTIENWSRNMLNLNTKKAIVNENATMEWVTGSFGSKISMLYPFSVLEGDNSSTVYTGLTFAGEGQTLDTGFKVLHKGKNTNSVIDSKSISKSGGSCLFRSMISALDNSVSSKSSVNCESLLLDNISTSNTIPFSSTLNGSVSLSHEASVGKLSDKEIFYLMSRGFSEKDAKTMIIRGFADPIAKLLPFEYAVEMNNLINLEFEGSIG